MSKNSLDAYGLTLAPNTTRGTVETAMQETSNFILDVIRSEIFFWLTDLRLAGGLTYLWLVKLFGPGSS